MKCIISLKEQYGKELNTFDIEGKYFGDVLQIMESKLCNEISPYNTYSLKNYKNINKKAMKKTLHFSDDNGNILSYIIEIKNSIFNN